MAALEQTTVPLTGPSSATSTTSTNPTLTSTPTRQSVAPPTSPLPRPRTPRLRNSPRNSPVIRRTSSHLSANGASMSTEGSPRLGPMADPYHHRAPSLGELHQELESEQEGRVNRLLGMIRQQQAQLDTTATSTSQLPPPPPRSRTPSSTRTSLVLPTPTSSSSTAHQLHHRQPLASPALPHLSLGNPSVRSPGHPLESPDWIPREKERDDLAFYRAETASVQRENRMLEVRVAELERLIAAGRKEAGASASASVAELDKNTEQASRGRR